MPIFELLVLHTRFFRAIIKVEIDRLLKVVFQVSAMELKSRLDLTEIFCDVDDFYICFERYCRSIPQLTAILSNSR